MQTKLTLRLDERLIRRAKTHAKRTGRSVSQMVADYFALLGRSTEQNDMAITPLVKQLKGALRRADVDEDDYRRHLEDRHL